MPRLSAPVTPTVTLGDALAAWYRSLRVSRKSPRTIEAYEYALAKLTAAVGDDRPLVEVRKSDIETLILGLMDGGMSPGGVSAIYRPMRTFWNWCVANDEFPVTASPLKGIKAPTVPVVPVKHPSDDEWRAILRTTVERSKHAYRARRDRAILLMLESTGARLSEVANLRLSDVDLASNVVTVMGKGSKVRVLPLLPDVVTALVAYMRLERPRSPHAASEALWLGPKGPLSSSGIAQLLGQRAKAAGIERTIHPHMLRHRFMSNALKDGMPAPLLMTLSGHSTPSMLVRYGQSNRAEDAMAMYREMAANRK